MNQLSQLKRWTASGLATMLLGAGLTASAAHAENPPSLAPGLWEMTTRMKAGDAATNDAMATAQARIAQMPAEQRRQMEQALAARGVDVRLGADALVARICMTREMTERDAIASQHIGNCKTERSARSGNTIKFAAVCSDPRSTTEGVTTILDPKTFESRTTTTAESAGTTRMTTMTQTGRWVGADCGAVKPAAR